jgi:D-sedoheptulose 7-phosphate isomerase
VTPKHNSESLRSLILDRIGRSIDAKEALRKDEKFQELVMQVALQMVKSLENGGTIFFAGNGGSAADAQHLAAEFTGRFLKERRPLPSIALSVNSSSLTAIGNDYGFELSFARPLEALGKAGDVLVGISTSGNSPNVIKALEVANTKSIYSVALTGKSGGKMKNIAKTAICIPSDETPRIQECHVLTGHLICEIVEEVMF